MKRKEWKEIEKSVDELVDGEIHKKDEEGRVVIDLSIKDDSDFLSVLSDGDDPIISSEIAEFIENSTEDVSMSDSLTLRIHSNCIDDNEKQIYPKAIKKYYLKKYSANKRESVKNKILITILFSLGIIALAIAIALSVNLEKALWSEVVDIVAWVFVWEAVDIWVFRNRSIRLKRRCYIQYLSMNVEFYND